MSNNIWIIAPAIAGLILVGLGYNMYSNNKEATANTAKYYADLAKDDLDSRFGGRKTKRRKYRKNASKKRR